MRSSPLNRALVSGAVTATCLAAASGTAVAQEPAPTQPSATLVGRAVLPANTFAAGPPSGTLLGGTPSNGVTPPFASQPVQGISGILRTSRRGTYLGLSDNGFGSKANSADFLLRLHRLRPDFRRGDNTTGTIRVGSFIQLRDPFRRIPFPIVREATPDRLLTGADFDPESVRRDSEGDFWFGEEFGPYLLHTDSRGRVLEAPIPLPGVKSPQNPTLAAGEVPNLGASRGFEGTAISPDATKLYPMLEGALTDDADQRRRYIFEFDLASRAYTGTRWQYRTEQPGHAIGDLTSVGSDRLLVIERDNLQGDAAAFKKLYLIDLSETDAEGFLVKREVVDFLSVRDPFGISEPPRAGDIGLGSTFEFPFQTIEAVLPLGPRRLLVLNDNNFPFSAGRNPTRPDDTEAILLRVPGLEGR